jgi:hypothetical protein
LAQVALVLAQLQKVQVAAIAFLVALHQLAVEAVELAGEATLLIGLELLVVLAAVALGITQELAGQQVHRVKEALEVAAIPMQQLIEQVVVVVVIVQPVIMAHQHQLELAVTAAMERAILIQVHP